MGYGGCNRRMRHPLPDTAIYSTTRRAQRLSQNLHELFAAEVVRWPGQAETITQRSFHIIFARQSSALQLRYNELCKVQPVVGQ
jgi:hypothetical protein